MLKFYLAPVSGASRHHKYQWFYGLFQYPKHQSAATTLFQCWLHPRESEEDFAKRLYNEAKAQGHLQAILSTTTHAGATQTPQILERLRVLAENESAI
jgi:hypothetical protein